MPQDFWKLYIKHCMQSILIRSFSGPYFPIFRLNTDQKNFEYEHILHSERVKRIGKFLIYCSY